MIFGYRTNKSMKNKDTWIFAHNYCGKLWRVIGLIMLIVSVIAMIFILGKNIIVISIFGGILCGIQIIFMVLPIFFTERALEINFDTHGNRRK